MILEAENITCDRGGRRVFENLSFRLKAGDCLELRGANGAGKSSLLRLLAGFDTPASGGIKASGEAIFVGHSDAIKPALTVRENLDFWARCFDSQKASEALSAFNLHAMGDQPAAYLSQGQKRRLALSRLALLDRPLWLLDEPTVGLDAASVDMLCTLMKSRLASGGAIVAATHTDLPVPPSQTLTLPVRP